MRVRFFPSLALVLGSAALVSSSALVTACSDDTANASTRSPESDSGTSSTDEHTRDDESTPSAKDAGADTSNDAKASEQDAEVDAADARVECPATPAVPDLNGPNQCGAIDFGLPAAMFEPVKDDAGLQGGTLPSGIYDTITAERASGAKGSWRETIVLAENGRFTRTRQIDPGTGNLGPLTYRSGTYSMSGNEITLTDDCSSTDLGGSTLPYNVVMDECGLPMLQYSATGFRFTLKRR